MNTINVEIVSDLFTFSHQFEHRLSIIIGNSGVGKSSLRQLLTNNPDDPDTYIAGVQVNATYPVIDARSTTWKDVIVMEKDKIIIFDDLSVVESAKFSDMYSQYAIKNNLWFIIINRSESIGQDNFKGRRLSYAVSDIYEMKEYKEKHWLVPAYKLKFVTEDTIFSTCITEDTASGFAFVAALFSNSKVYHSSNGKSSLCEDIESISGKPTIVFADLASFGCHISEFYNKFYASDVYLVKDYYCFEELLVNTNLFCKNDLDKLYSAKNMFLSDERYYEYVIKELSKEKPFAYTHRNGHLADCYVTNCINVTWCTSQLRDKYGCAVQIDKFVFLLFGTKYEFLLKLAGRITDNFSDFTSEEVVEEIEKYREKLKKLSHTITKNPLKMENA